MEVSVNGVPGTPKSSLLIGFSIRQNPFWGSFLETSSYYQRVPPQNRGSQSAAVTCRTSLALVWAKIRNWKSWRHHATPSPPAARFFSKIFRPILEESHEICNSKEVENLSFQKSGLWHGWTDTLFKGRIQLTRLFEQVEMWTIIWTQMVLLFLACADMCHLIRGWGEGFECQAKQMGFSWKKNDPLWELKNPHTKHTVTKSTCYN